MYKKYLTWINHVLPKIGIIQENPILTPQNMGLWEAAPRVSNYKKVILTVMATLLISLLQAQGLKDRSVNVSFSNATLEEALKALESKVNVRFVFSEQLVDQPRRVNGTYNQPFRTVVEAILKPFNIDYEIVDDQYVILKSKKTASVGEQAQSPAVPVNQRGFVQTGTVVDENNQPIVGAVVIVLNANNTAQTDSRGHYAIGVPDDQYIIAFRYLGYKRLEQQSNRNAELNVQLQPDPGKLDEVTVIGYGTTTKRAATGSTTRVLAEQIQNSPVTNVAQALQGRMPGVYISQSNGLPGSPMNFTIRGTNSIPALTGVTRSNPLFVVDGVPFMADAINAQAGNSSLDGANGSASPLNTINPLDIESIDILKDADATAIYGSRAANGVVLITTKKGKSGKTQVDAMVRHGASEVGHFVKTLNTQEYLAIRAKGFENSGTNPVTSNAFDLTQWDQEAYTDFQKLLIGNTAKTTDANVAISGGDLRTNFRISGTHHREGNVFVGDQGYERSSVNFNMGHKSLNDRFNINLSAIYSADNNNVSVLDQTAMAYSLPPNYPLYNADGSLYWSGLSFGVPNNPLALLNNEVEYKSSNLIANLNLSYRIWDGLSFKTALGYGKADADQKRLSPMTSKDPALSWNVSNSMFAYNVSDNYIIEPQFAYNKTIAKGQLNALIGGTWQNQKSRQPFYIMANNFPSDDFLEVLSMAATVSTSSSSSEYKYASLFGRINYNWASKYILNLNFRRDGSSRFAENSRYGNFGSVGAAWIFSEEDIVKNLSWLSFGKLRGSYGVVGNDQIGDYSYYDSYTSYAYLYNGLTGLYPTRIANPNYQWEETKKLEVALELGFLEDKISLSTAFYRNRSDNQLVSYPLSPQAGFSSYQANFPALVENQGWEFTLSTQNVKTADFRWNTDVNLSINRNKLLEFPNIENTSYYTQYVVGRPLSSFYVYEYTGFDETTGLPTFADLNGSGAVNAGLIDIGRGDRYYAGSRLPKYFGGVSNTLSYKNITLDFLFQFVKQKGYSILSGSYYPPGYFMSNYAAEPILEYINAGLPSQPQITATYNAAYPAWSNYVGSDAVLTDASFIRLKNVSLSYDVRGEWVKRLKLQNLRLQLQGQNLFTITDYIGFDPESQGAVLPPLRTISGVIQFTF